MARWYDLSKTQYRNLERVPQGVDISTIAAVDLEALGLVYMRETNDGTEVHLTTKGRAAMLSKRVMIE
jgi:hypothetical protein